MLAIIGFLLFARKTEDKDNKNDKIRLVISLKCFSQMVVVDQTFIEF